MADLDDIVESTEFQFEGKEPFKVYYTPGAHIIYKGPIFITLGFDIKYLVERRQDLRGSELAYILAQMLKGLNEEGGHGSQNKYIMGLIMIGDKQYYGFGVGPKRMIQAVFSEHTVIGTFKSSVGEADFIVRNPDHPLYKQLRSQ